MSKTLARLLEQPERVMTETITKLENMAGHPGEDVRLLNEIQLSARHKIAQLGLDPIDTSAEELYHALEAKCASAVQVIEKAFGLSSEADDQIRAQKAVEVAEHLISNSEVWSLKHSVSTQLIKANPPRQLMKQLGYRSLDSMLKRESVEGIITAT